MTPIAQAREDWRNGISSDENPYPSGTQAHEDYAWEFHRLLHDEFVRDCLAPKEPYQGNDHEKVA
ncbi:hypothetical protein [Marinobacter shengliensis]|uniref:hypothetical protein n=1 Tax=Marinobacter shengliensis TaxID=1389223 RepID=UPI001E5606A8|nr:hypothetical protein [Marinobacter shengliensis]